MSTSLTTESSTGNSCLEFQAVTKLHGISTSLMCRPFWIPLPDCLPCRRRSRCSSWLPAECQQGTFFGKFMALIVDFLCLPWADYLPKIKSYTSFSPKLRGRCGSSTVCQERIGKNMVENEPQLIRIPCCSRAVAFVSSFIPLLLL